MAPVSRSSFHEQTYNHAVLLPPWQKNNLSHLTNHTNNGKKARQIQLKKNVNTTRNELLTSHVTIYNRFAILEFTDDSMYVVETLTNQHTQKDPPLPPIFIDDIIDIETVIKSIEEDVTKEDYKLKINNQVKILPANPDSYRKLTKLLKTLHANFHTYQLKQERPFRVVLRNIHHSANLDELKFELLNHAHEISNISNTRHSTIKIPLS